MTDKEEPDQPETPDEQAEPEARRGRMRFQDETTEPRPPTLGEQRARRKALEREAEQEAEVVEAERKSKVRRRILIGSGVTVGVVALVAVWYNVASPSEVTAHCVADNDVVAPAAEICDDPNYVTNHGGYYSGGFFFLPIPGGGYNRYHYYYGGSVDAGGRVFGGSATAPSSRTTVKSSSGKTVQRGGFGISGGSKSGGS